MKVFTLLWLVFSFNALNVSAEQFFTEQSINFESGFQVRVILLKHSVNSDDVIKGVYVKFPDENEYRCLFPKNGWQLDGLAITLGTRKKSDKINDIISQWNGRITGNKSAWLAAAWDVKIKPEEDLIYFKIRPVFFEKRRRFNVGKRKFV